MALTDLSAKRRPFQPRRARKPPRRLRRGNRHSDCQLNPDRSPAGTYPQRGYALAPTGCRSRSTIAA